jgi:carboxylesterase type B
MNDVTGVIQHVHNSSLKVKEAINGTAGATSRKLLPVVFWIHGGGLIQGSEVTPFLYHPRTFTDRGVIFVSINYRLGPLGKYTLNILSSIAMVLQ